MNNISRRKFIKDAMFGSIGLGFASKNSFSIKQNSQKNVLFIIIDDLRSVLGAYDNTVINSPNIDKFASEGILFRKSFSQVPVCGPSRVSLLTGLRVEQSKYNLSTDKLNRPFTSLPAYFKNHGYYTTSLGKVFHIMNDCRQDWSEAPWRSEAMYYGKYDWAHFDTYHLWKDKNSANYVNSKTGRGPYYEAANVGESTYQDVQLTNKAIDKLEELKNSKPPFFLAIGFWRPHLPFNAPQKYWEMYDNISIPIANNRFRPTNLPREVTNSREILSYGRTDGWPDSPDFHRISRHAYYACVSHIDHQIGRILQMLNESYLAGNTIVVLTADHGWNLGEHNFWGKHNLIYNATHVPLIIKAPGHSPKSISNVVESLDIYPTLCDLTGLTKPNHLEGKSLMPLIDNQKMNRSAWANKAFATWNSGYNIITERYSYVEWINSNSKMLFDHKLDPDENKNVVNSSKYKYAVDKLNFSLHNKFIKNLRMK